ncbi:hypothetical protein WJX84_002736 [Apatococcus fuscideae]|uniref:arginine--tRNA ligase n=1 Tax=Apatococcus fuscideae TaxID=2026836 RepID=A0AAW1TAR3_9CHLO
MDATLWMLEERGESFYNPQLAPLVSELIQQGVIEESNGAQVVWVEGEENPLIVQKADGAFLYGTTDLAAIRHRLQVERGDWLIYVTDLGQAGHFDLVFGAAKKAGFILPKGDPNHPRIDHVGFGLVLGADGKRIRTRSGGDIVKLVELLDEAKERCAATIKERREDISEEELDTASSAMGYGAIKYADLKNHRTTNYKFDFDAMCDLKGNTAVYLLYAHARIASIVRKADRPEVSDGTLAKSSSIDLQHPAEIALALHLIRFPEALEDMLEDLTPNRLTEYLYLLTDKFNTFYTNCHVIGEKEEDSRLLLVQSVAVIMRQCFFLLGLTPLYRI